MTDDDHDPLRAALKAVPNTRGVVAGELRRMAQAEGEYRRFCYVSPWIRNTWHAAADLLEAEAPPG